MEIKLLEYPTGCDWEEVKRRALVTIGKTPITAPSEQWKMDILNARHSPIRYLRFSVFIGNLPSWVSVHLARHVHAQPYIKTQRNDRQKDFDRTKAPQDTPVDMIWDLNAEEMMIVANKRLCNQASPETRYVVQKICDLICEKCPEFKPFLVPMCIHDGGVCHEMYPCGRCIKG